MAESKTSTKATAGILLRIPDTTVDGGGFKNNKVTQWSPSLVDAAPVLQAWHAACEPALDHMPEGHGTQFVLLTLANVPAVQLGQKDTVSEVEAEPRLHLEQSCVLVDGREMRKLYSAVELPITTLLILTNEPGPQVAVKFNCSYWPTYSYCSLVPPMFTIR
jgi:hypothetical protein